MDSAEFLDLLGNANRRRILQLLARKPCYVTEISEFLGVSPKAVIDHLRKLEDAGLVESRTDDRRRKYFSIARHIRLEVTVSPYEFGTKSAYPASSHLDITTCRRVSIELEDGSVAPLEEFSAGESGVEHPVDDDTEPTAEAEADGDTIATGAELDQPDSEGASETRDEDSRVDRESGLAVVSGEEVVSLVEQLRDFQQLERELSLAHRWAEGRITQLRDRLADSVGSANPRLVSEVLLALAEEARTGAELSREMDVPPGVLEEVLGELAAADVVDQEDDAWRLKE